MRIRLFSVATVGVVAANGCVVYSYGAFVTPFSCPPRSHIYSSNNSNNNNNHQGGASSEADLIYAINACRTLDNVGRLVNGAAAVDVDVDAAAAAARSNHATKTTPVPAALTVGPNIAAAALRKTVQLSNGWEETHSDTHIHTLAPLPLLLQNIETAVGRSLARREKDHPPPPPLPTTIPPLQTTTPMTMDESITPYALADTLVSLSKLSNRRSTRQYRPLAEQVCELMERQPEHFIRVVRPKRLMQCVEAMSWLSLPKPDFLRAAYLRLSKGDALSVLSARDLSYIVHLCSHLDHAENVVPPKVMQTFLRRIRKEQVRTTATPLDLGRAMVAAEQLVSRQQQQLHQPSVSVPPPPSSLSSLSSPVKDDTETMFYTLSREMLLRDPTSFRASFVGKILTACYKIGMNPNEQPFEGLSRALCDGIQPNIATAKDISLLFASMQHMRLTNNPNTVHRLGVRFQKFAQVQQQQQQQQQQQTANSTTLPLLVEPITVNKILRSAVLLHRQDPRVMQPFLIAAKQLFLTEAFLEQCSLMELSNFVWFMAMAKWYDEDVLVALANRILEPDVHESCSPKIASCILGAFTTLTTRTAQQQHQQQSTLERLRFNLFHTLGPYFLSTQMTPADASTAIFAYARAPYVEDMGIFDHLVEWMASQLQDDDGDNKTCTTRQIVQSLWACGKMMTWEEDYQEEYEQEPISTSTDTSNFATHTAAVAPPYLISAQIFAGTLSTATKISDLTAKDVSQSIWACGRLGIADVKIVYSLAYQAKQVAEQCTSQEIANILWGLAKVDFSFDDRDVVATLTNELLNNESRSPNSQEAANVLYALGRMRIRDKEAFSALNDIMMSQLQEASAQAIANALWAHRAVEISPPQKLMDSWAMQKLGLDSVSIRIPSDYTIE